MIASSHLPVSLRRLAGVVLLAVMALVVAAVTTGRVGYVVTSGVSMRPSYQTGDLVIVVRSRNYHQGQIVEYHGGASGHVPLLHRIIGGDDVNGYVIKGDNNQSVDPTHPRADQVIGRAVLHIPRIGTVVDSPITRGLVGLALIALFGGLIMKPSPRRGAKHGSRRASDQTNTLWKVLLALDLVVAGAAAAAFGFASHPVTPPGPSDTQTAVLTYQATPPVSDTYPTGSVATGDPVFTKLLDTVGVTFRYSTSAPAGSVHGTVRLDAAISTVSGWHTNIPLAAPTPLLAGAAEVTAPLDLGRIQALVGRVAKASGVGAGTADIVVTASGTVTDRSAKPVAYKAHLPLQLTPLEATLSGATVSPSLYGPALVATSSLSAPVAASHTSKGVTDEVRLALLAFLLAAVAATAVVWPSPKGAENDRDGNPLVRTEAVGIHVADSTTQVQVADRAALTQIARGLGAAIIHGQDGWEGVCAPDVLYWAVTAQPHAGEQLLPAGLAAVRDNRADGR